MPYTTGGTSAYDANGNPTRLRSDYDGNLGVEIASPSAMFDASGAVRTSQKRMYGEYKVLNDTFNDKLLEQVGTGTFTVNDNMVNMAVAAGQYCIIQSKQYHPYFNGASQSIDVTFSNFGQDGETKRVGYYSSVATGPYDTGYDGFFFEMSSAGFPTVQVWRGGTKVAEAVQATHWVDKLDGTGPSEYSADWDEFTVMSFDFLYLGGTSLRCYIVVGGKKYLFAKLDWTSNLADEQPFMKSPNKPIRYEIRGDAGGGSMNFICAAVNSENGSEPHGTSYSVFGADAGIAMSSGTTYAVCGVRKASTERDIYAQVDRISGTVGTADNVRFSLILNPTVAGTFNYSAVAGTPLETATGAVTNTVTGGFAFDSLPVTGKGSNKDVVESKLAHLNSTINNTMDCIVLCATPILGSTNATATGAIRVTWINQ